LIVPWYAPRPPDAFSCLYRSTIYIAAAAGRSLAGGVKLW
jgi:hypothetical protein